MRSATESYIYLKHNEWFERLAYSEICYLEASGSYCTVYTTERKKKITVSQPLGDITRFLPENIFIRIHRSFVINVNHVNQYTGNSFIVGSHEIPIGRSYKKEALAHFNIVM